MTGISRHGYVPEAVSLFDAAESAQTVRFVSTWPFSMSSATVRYLREGDGWSRREADCMDRGEDVVIGRETAPTDVASGNNWRPRKSRIPL